VVGSADTFEKFKALQKELARQQAQIVYLEEQKKKLDQVVMTTSSIREFERERGRIVDEMKTMVAGKNPVFTQFAHTFNTYCQRVLNHEGMFYFYVNTNNNLDYHVSLGTAGQIGKASSQGEGTSYKKLVCALFDLALLKVYKLALLKVYKNAPFFHFVFHDGVLEALDDRKKEALLELVREEMTDNKIQYIMTLIEADLPRDRHQKLINFDENEIVLRLHDEGNNGRLFKMGEF
jgi:uncharacterized protein YydD (DUF2326 family)